MLTWKKSCFDENTFKVWNAKMECFIFLEISFYLFLFFFIGILFSWKKIRNGFFIFFIIYIYLTFLNFTTVKKMSKNCKLFCSLEVRKLLILKSERIFFIFVLFCGEHLRVWIEKFAVSYRNNFNGYFKLLLLYSLILYLWLC